MHASASPEYKYKTPLNSSSEERPGTNPAQICCPPLPTPDSPHIPLLFRCTGLQSSHPPLTVVHTCPSWNSLSESHAAQCTLLPCTARAKQPFPHFGPCHEPADSTQWRLNPGRPTGPQGSLEARLAISHTFPSQGQPCPIDTPPGDAIRGLCAQMMDRVHQQLELREKLLSSETERRRKAGTSSERAWGRERGPSGEEGRERWG